MAMYGRSLIYRNLKRKIIIITLLVSCIPLIFLGGTIYFQFEKAYKEKLEDQIKQIAGSQRNTLEIFLKERATILSTIVDTHTFDYLKEQKNLSFIFEVINRRAENLGLVDLV